MTGKTFSTEAVVVKRYNTGEYDRVVTFLTPTEGKLTCVAKGVRKMTSSQRAYLEPGNHVSIHLVATKSMSLVTQTRLINDFQIAKKDLKSIKKLAEILEIIDLLFPEGVEEEQLFQDMVEVISALDRETVSYKHIQEKLNQVLIQLGYQDFYETKYASITEYVAQVADRPLHSYNFLTVRK